eukprot:9181513-Prorocentrum_lima.AAC.1
MSTSSLLSNIAPTGVADSLPKLFVQDAVDLATPPPPLCATSGDQSNVAEHHESDSHPVLEERVGHGDVPPSVLPAGLLPSHQPIAAADEAREFESHVVGLLRSLADGDPAMALRSVPEFP